MKFKNKFLTIFIALVFVLTEVNVLWAQTLPNIPSDIKEIVDERDMIEIYCLMTKYESGEFIASLEALNTILVPAVSQLKNMGFEAEVPDITQYQFNAQTKIDEVCTTQSLTEAQNRVQDLMAYSQQIKNDLAGLRNSLGVELKSQGQELKEIIETENKKIEEELGSQIQPKVEEFGADLGARLQIELEHEMASAGFTDAGSAQAYAQRRVAENQNRIKTEIENYKNQLQTEFENEMDARASEVAGFNIKEFRELGDGLANIEQTINDVVQQNLGQYEEYKIQAMIKRKELILKIFDQQFNQAIEQIKEYEDLLLELKVQDPSVLTANELIAELNQDKQILAEQIQTAIEAGDDSGFQIAIQEVENKWLAKRTILESNLAKRQSPWEVCQQVDFQIQKAKTTIEDGLQQIQIGLEQIEINKIDCALSEKPLCQTIDQIYNNLKSTQSIGQTLLNNLNLTIDKCSHVSPQDNWQSDFLQSMLSLREAGPAWNKEIVNLKNQWLSQK
ncbi:MAG: hypothetical protein PHS07_03280 [Patescibacteria group bacterium]|nr:hypothetical protein [Patescibacteria group bacterium]